MCFKNLIVYYGRLQSVQSNRCLQQYSVCLQHVLLGTVAPLTLFLTLSSQLCLYTGECSYNRRRVWQGGVARVQGAAARVGQVQVWAQPLSWWGLREGGCSGATWM